MTSILAYYQKKGRSQEYSYIFDKFYQRRCTFSCPILRYRSVPVPVPVPYIPCIDRSII